jgi:hypothetical protein
MVARSSRNFQPWCRETDNTGFQPKTTLATLRVAGGGRLVRAALAMNYVFKSPPGESDDDRSAPHLGMKRRSRRRVRLICSR